MTLLELLAACIEQGRTFIAPAMAEEATRKRLDRLHKAGALVRVRARAIICPQCEANSVRVIQVGAGLCRACGQVALAAEDLQRLAPDHDWLHRRMAQALV
jgi:ribosomal protein L37AE/L43A